MIKITNKNNLEKEVLNKINPMQKKLSEKHKLLGNIYSQKTIKELFYLNQSTILVPTLISFVIQLHQYPLEDFNTHRFHRIGELFLKHYDLDIILHYTLSSDKINGYFLDNDEFSYSDALIALNLLYINDKEVEETNNEKLLDDLWELNDLLGEYCNEIADFKEKL